MRARRAHPACEAYRLFHMQERRELKTAFRVDRLHWLHNFFCTAGTNPCTFPRAGEETTRARYQANAAWGLLRVPRPSQAGRPCLGGHRASTGPRGEPSVSAPSLQRLDRGGREVREEKQEDEGCECARGREVRRHVCVAWHDVCSDPIGFLLMVREADQAGLRRRMDGEMRGITLGQGRECLVDVSLPVCEHPWGVLLLHLGHDCPRLLASRTSLLPHQPLEE